MKKNLLKNETVKKTSKILLLIFFTVLFIMIQSVVVHNYYGSSFFVYFILVLLDIILFFVLFRWYFGFHEKSVETLEEVLTHLSKSGEMKPIHLSKTDKESKELARHINKVIIQARKNNLSVYQLLGTKQQENVQLEEQNEQSAYRIKELQIYSDISERITYMQNIPAIVEIVAGSIEKLLTYTSVSYVLLDEDVLNFHIRIEDMVNRSYIREIKNKMIDSLVGLTGSEDIKKIPTEEIITGSIVDDLKKTKVGSFFNGPLVIGGKIVGLLNVASVKADNFTERQMGVLFTITKKVSNAVESLQHILEEEKSKLSAMVSSISDGLLVVDTHLKIMTINPALKIMLNLALSEVALYDVVDKVHGILDVRTKLQEAIKLDKLISEPNFQLGELYLKPVFSPVRDKGGEIIGAVMLLQDVTKERDLQRLREDFTSMMVHELRSPIDGIKKISELMKISPPTDEKNYQEFVQMIYDGSSRMLELVNDLLDVAKLEAGKFKVQQAPSDIKKLIEDRLKFFQAVATDGKVKLTANIMKNIPQNVNFDYFRIVQVLNNLISNALKFTKPGGTVEIQAMLHKSEKNLCQEAKENGIKWFISEKCDLIQKLPDSLLVAVTDTGIGIPKESIGQLFNKFTQFKAATFGGDKAGTGLGLAISKGIIEAHNGTVSIESQEGSGSTFYFMIPI
jgi:signal transduction histidine kinase